MVLSIPMMRWTGLSGAALAPASNARGEDFGRANIMAAVEPELRALGQKAVQRSRP